MTIIEDAEVATLEQLLSDATKTATKQITLQNAHEQALGQLEKTDLRPKRSGAHIYFDHISTPLEPLRWSCFESRFEIFPVLVTKALNRSEWIPGEVRADVMQAAILSAVIRHFQDVNIAGYYAPRLPFIVEMPSGSPSLLRIPVEITNDVAETGNENLLVSYLCFYRNTWPHVGATSKAKEEPI